MADFMPRRDSELNVWTGSVATVIAADPARFGATVQQASAYSEVQRRYAEALQAATNGATRGPMRVGMKNAARAELEKATREMVRRVRLAAVSQPVILTELDLPQIGAGRGAVKSGGVEQWPISMSGGSVDQGSGLQEKPVISARVTGRQVDVQLLDELRKSRPLWAKGAVVSYHVGDHIPSRVEEMTAVGNTTRMKMRFVLPTDTQPGSRVFIVAQWLDRQLRRGPVGNPVTVYAGFEYFSREAA